MNFNRIKGVLIALKKFKDEIGDTKGISDCVRGANKKLKHFAASTTMELLSYEEIQDIYYEYLKKSRDEMI